MSRLNEKIFNWVKEESKTMGFLDCRAIELTRDNNFDSFKNWIDNKHHQPLEYLNNNLDKREYPQNLGSNLKSAFIFIHPYPSEWQSKYVAKYASGNDYHIELKSKLRNLSEKYNNHFHKLNDEKICVDTIPILERSLAQSSGIGWIGKNGCLISKEFGSFTLIAIWLTSLEINDIHFSSPQHFHCGNCTRCLDLCPTDAFLEPGKLSVIDCLSTQTIENRKLIPEKYHTAMKDTAFGCDVCQDVCPWNRKHFNDGFKEYLPPINKLLLMEENEFRSYFRKTAMNRPSWAGLKRNFLILASHNNDVPKSTFIKYSKHSNDIISQTAKQILENKW